jgi:hypothetical protein
MLNLTPGEPLSMVKTFPYFDDPIELDVLLVGSLHLGVHDLIIFFLFDAFRIDLCRGQVLNHVRSVEKRWKIWSNQFHINYGVQAKERGNN